jgi:soluble lytic murein transglycosylase-like protein
MDDFIFPLRQRPDLDYRSGGRQFGANRPGGRKHAACDMIAPPGTQILAMADGVVRRGPYDFYSGTSALEVKHRNGMVLRYGEISKIVPALTKVDAAVSQGQVIAHVGRLNSGESMLHLEMYKDTATGPLTQAGGGEFSQFMRRSDLVDPTSFLDSTKLFAEPERGDGPEGRVGSVLNVRSAPSTNAQVDFQLGPGTVVKVLAEITGDAYKWDRKDWLKIENNGRTGFVAGFYVSLDQPHSAAAPTSAATPTVAAAPPATAAPSAGSGEQPPQRWVAALLQAETTGASEVTARQDGLSSPGIQASQTLAEHDLAKVSNIASRFVSAAAKFGLPPALLAALASRESRCGGVLSHDGWGDRGNAFGIMQVDKRFHEIAGEPDPASLGHIEQATGIFAAFLAKIIDRHADWEDKNLLKGAAVAYNAGIGTVQTVGAMDRGTTGNDYGSDVIARAQHYHRHPDLELFRA